MKGIFTIIILAMFAAASYAEDAKAKSPVPSHDEINSALTTVKDVFKDEYKGLKTPDDRKALAKKLIGQAADPGNNPAMVYALITEAARVSGEAGDIASIAEASKIYADKFEGDAVAARKKMLEAAEKAAAKPNPESMSLLAEEFLKLADEAIAADDFTSASAAADSAARIAKKAKNTTIAAKAADKKKEASDALSALKSVSSAMDKLKTLPTDPDANFAVGKYVCFIKGDWDEGLPMLATGSSKDYKDAAELDLTAKDASSILKSADKWWDLSEMEKDKALKPAIKERAAMQYKKILAELNGIDKVKAEKRMKESEASATANPAVKSAASAKGNSSGKSNLPSEIAKIAKDARERKGTQTIKVSPDGSVPGTESLEAGLKKLKSGMTLHLSPGDYESLGGEFKPGYAIPPNCILEGEKGAVLRSLLQKEGPIIIRNLTISGSIQFLGHWQGRESNVMIDCKVFALAYFDAKVINSVISFGCIRGDFYNCTFFSDTNYVVNDGFNRPNKYYNCVFYGKRSVFKLRTDLKEDELKKLRSELDSCVVYGEEAAGAVDKSPDKATGDFAKTFKSLSMLKDYFSAKNCIEVKPEFENSEEPEFMKKNLRLKSGSPGTGKAKGGGDIGANLDSEGFPVP